MFALEVITCLMRDAPDNEGRINHLRLTVLQKHPMGGPNVASSFAGIIDVCNF